MFFALSAIISKTEIMDGLGNMGKISFGLKKLNFALNVSIFSAKNLNDH